MLSQPSQIHLFEKNYYFVWDVGQGLWTTHYSKGRCVHYDMGGEYAPLNEIIHLCQHSENIIHITHADKDHINFVKPFVKSVKNHCFANSPQQLHFKLKKKDLKKCRELANSAIYVPTTKQKKALNDTSQVFIINETILNPGDSPKSREMRWAQKKSLNRIAVLILGHHGSLTSTSPYLLKKLRQLKYTIASARKAKYGHPHGLIQIRLQKNKTPVISTNDWGSLVIEL